MGDGLGEFGEKWSQVTGVWTMSKKVVVTSGKGGGLLTYSPRTPELLSSWLQISQVFVPILCVLGETAKDHSSSSFM